jgi:hypothetical protein
MPLDTSRKSITATLLGALTLVLLMSNIGSVAPQPASRPPSPAQPSSGTTAVAGTATPGNPLSGGTAPSQPPREQAQVLALFGHNQLHLGRVADAQIQCESALKSDPSNAIAKDCLDWAARMQIDQDLNNAAASLVGDKKTDALTLASKWGWTGADTDQRTRAWQIIDRARSKSLSDLYLTLPAWLRDTVVAIAAMVASGLLLLVTRALWRKWRRGKWYSESHKTKWKVLPLKELPSSDPPTGIPTNVTMDALARLGHELAQPPWEPKLLLLRPTPPADYEPAVISDFLAKSLCPLKLVPPPEDLRIAWELQQIQLDQAVQNLQLKTAGGVDIGSVARFLRSIVEWFTTGAPTISGVAQTTAERATIHMAASGGPVSAIAVTTSTDVAPGINPIQLSAERAALKFLLRMRFPHLTTGQVDGFAALRQGASQFGQYAGTVPGRSSVGAKDAGANAGAAAGTGNNVQSASDGKTSMVDDVETRRSTLAKAAYNFEFVRASIPRHCNLSQGSHDCNSLKITDQIRQSILLAEGVANALVGSEQSYVAAIDCFRQLEDWPGPLQTETFRQQAIYNEAIVWRQLGYEGRCVLMLTELLGQTVPDLNLSAEQEAPSEEATRIQEERQKFPDALRLPVRVARLAAFAAYDRDVWEILPPARAELVIGDGEQLVDELAELRRKGLDPGDARLAKYMYIEALRAIGHVELMHCISGDGANLYQKKRPVLINDPNVVLTNEAKARLLRAIKRMQMCELLSPTCDLFCDLAESFLLLKDFRRAQGYARHATLESKPDEPAYERAHYLATESYFLEGTDASKSWARKYAEAFKGTVRMEEFNSVRKELEPKQ